LWRIGCHDWLGTLPTARNARGIDLLIYDAAGKDTLGTLLRSTGGKKHRNLTRLDSQPLSSCFTLHVLRSVPIPSLKQSMARQPFLPFLLRNREGRFDVGTQALRRRPEIELLIANCLMAWPPAEAEMALLLAWLLGAQESEATLAVFQSLRRSSRQRDALTEAARIVLSEGDRELLGAIINVHKTVESERNALTHGHFETYSLLTDGVVWMDTKTYLDVKTRIELAYQPMSDEFLKTMYSKVRIYKASDLENIFESIKDIADIWGKFVQYLRASPAVQAELNQRLSERPRVSQELDKIRRNKSQMTPD
jgi:hypothetical protein